MASTRIIQYDTNEDGERYNAVALVDEHGDQTGIATKPLIGKDHSDAIADGDVPGAGVDPFCGYRGTLTSTIADLSELAATTIPLPASAIAMEVISTSDQDVAAGTGARTIEIHGLTTDFAEVSEIVTMTGTAAKVLQNTYLRINNMHVMTAGTGTVPAGTITLRPSGGGTIYCMISVGMTMSLQAHYTVPAGKVATIESWTPSVETVSNAAIARIILFSTADWSDRTLLPGVYHPEKITLSSNWQAFTPHMRYPAGCDIKVAAQLVGGAGAAVAAVHLNIMIENA